ncbi:phytanoyl-CoA dioxygenase (PhyH) domain-containing protein [Ditylenchus destructor]|nr:phytanoyl-CoA dioxygenase (PhyH) domain-containing protein [Ditylenchus destructor]
MSAGSNVPRIEFSAVNFKNDAVRLFQEYGFVVVENVFSSDEAAEMQSAMDKIVDNLRPEEHPKSIFNTEDEEKHTTDSYFLESVDKIRFFYEEGAFDKSTGELQVPKNRALNKVGHALHWLDATFRKYTFSDQIKKIFSAVGYITPKIVQSMYIFKQPSIGGSVTDHIDSTFLQVDPPEQVIGVWIALDDATEANGCLWFIPGSQRESTADGYKFVRTFSGSDSCDVKGQLVKFTGTRPTYDQSRFIPVEVKTGSLVLIDGKVVHKSEPNTSDKSRHAYTFHVADLQPGTTWSPLAWLQETDVYRFPELYVN